MKLYAAMGRYIFWLLRPLICFVLRRTLRVYALVECGGRVLVVKNWLAEDTWRLPGGGVARGEEPLVALQRELNEELGLNLQSDQLRPLEQEQVNHLGFRYTTYYCLLDEMPSIHPSKFEIVDFSWSELSEIRPAQPELMRSIQVYRGLKMV